MVSVENKDPVRYGRIVLSKRLQSFDLGTGESFKAEAVEDYVKAIRIINGNVLLTRAALSTCGRAKNKFLSLHDGVRLK